MIIDKLDLDKKDVKILSLYMDNPDISQNEIAEELEMSQPSVFVRIQKLKKRGLLTEKIGVNFSDSNLFLCRVDLTSKNPNGLLEQMEKCPFFVNGFIISGENNVSLMLVHENLKKIDNIVNTHLRNQKSVSDINMNVIVSSAKDYVFQIDLQQELKQDENCNDPENCKNCNIIDIGKT